MEPHYYDFDMFSIGAGSGGVWGSRFAASFRASSVVCELSFATIVSETDGSYKTLFFAQSAMGAVTVPCEDENEEQLLLTRCSYYNYNGLVRDG
uniref:Uncharacterized protein n=1 Tax=Kalanchoe fedtschenkoi TaxID=63787 RepID=A0A7N0TBN9_KALFE